MRTFVLLLAMSAVVMSEDVSTIAAVGSVSVLEIQDFQAKTNPYASPFATSRSNPTCKGGQLGSAQTTHGKYYGCFAKPVNGVCPKGPTGTTTKQEITMNGISYCDISCAGNHHCPAGSECVKKADNLTETPSSSVVLSFQAVVPPTNGFCMYKGSSPPAPVHYENPFLKNKSHPSCQTDTVGTVQTTHGLYGGCFAKPVGGVCPTGPTGSSTKQEVSVNGTK